MTISTDMIQTLEPRRLFASVLTIDGTAGNDVVVDHDIGDAQAFEAVNGDEAGVAGAGADQKNRRASHG
jgi:hypothetical protein